MKLGFFEETRKDQPDGGICGSVYRHLNASEKAKWAHLDNLENRVVKAGSFKIAGSGRIVRFPGIPVKDMNTILFGS